MGEPWMIYFAAFAAVFLTVQFGFLFLTRSVQPRRLANRRLASIDRGSHRPSEVDLRKVIQGRNLPGFMRYLSVLVQQAGLAGSTRTLAVLFVGLTGIAAILLGSFMSATVAIVASVTLVGVVLYLALKFKRRRRLDKFAEQLPDVLDVIVRSLRAGHPFSVSLTLVAREMADPAGSEFGLASDEITYGRDIRTALQNLYERVGYEDLRFFVTAVTIQSQTGGNLGEILGRLSKMTRERFCMRRKIRALSSEGRFSAVALSVFPFLLFGMMNFIAPGFYGDVWNHPIVPVAFGVSGVLLLIGNIVMYKMVNFRI